jgi:hypothetical protein
MTIISMKKVKKVLNETNPDKREIADSGKKAMQQVCDQWIILFSEWVHLEQQKKSNREKIYESDIHAAFATFILRGVE